MTNQMTKEAWLADELLMLADGGEMPEVAFYSAINFLCEDEEGPGLELDSADYLLLKRGVVGRYRWIILRDLQPENRFTSVYRGLARSAANWQRLQGYGQREGLGPEVAALRPEVAQALLIFLRQEYRDVMENGQASSINCSADCLVDFARWLGLCLDEEIPQWRRLFREHES